jgi:hypothetical protein
MCMNFCVEGTEVFQRQEELTIFVKVSNEVFWY